MKIVICDDEKLGRKAVVAEIRRSVQLEDEDIELIEFSTGEELVEQYRQGLRADIIFLDIEMKQVDGIEAAKYIRMMDRKVILIFVSSHSEKALDTFDCETFHFIVKPFSHQKFESVFEKAVKKCQMSNDYFIITWQNQKLKVPVERIKYVECERKHMLFHTLDGKYKMVITVNETLKQLEPYGFVQTHQGYLVNMNMITGFDKQDVILIDNTRVMLSVRRRPEVVSKYANYVKRWK